MTEIVQTRVSVLQVAGPDTGQRPASNTLSINKTQKAVPNSARPSSGTRKLLARVVQSSNLSASFKQEAIRLAALVDGAPAGRQDALLRDLASVVLAKEQAGASLSSGDTQKSGQPQQQNQANGAAMDLKQALKQLHGYSQDAHRDNGNVKISVEAQLQQFAQEQTGKSLQQLGGVAADAVASLFGDPPGVRAQGPLSGAASFEHQLEAVLAKNLPVDIKA